MSSDAALLIRYSSIINTSHRISIYLDFKFQMLIGFPLINTFTLTSTPNTPKRQNDRSVCGCDGTHHVSIKSRIAQPLTINIVILCCFFFVCTHTNDVSNTLLFFFLYLCLLCVDPEQAGPQTPSYVT